MRRWMSTLLLRVRSLLRRSQIEQELDDELRFHFDQLIQEQIASGASPDEARERARRTMYGIELQKDRCRDVRRVSLVEDAMRDIRHALRMMRQQRAFTATAVLSLAIAIGTSTAVFSVVDALVLRKLPVSHPEELISSHGGSYVFLQRLRPLHDVLADAAGICLLDRFNVATAGSGSVDPGPVRVALITGNYLSMLGVRPRLGRALTPDDDRAPGAHPVAVLSDRYWRRHFDADPRAVGRTLSLLGVTYTIVGVMPQAFEGDTVGRPIDMWMPVMMQSQVMPELPGLLTRSNGFLRIVARLQPRVSLERARAAMQTVYTRDQIEAAGPNASPQTLQSIARDRLEIVSMATGYARDRDTITLSLTILAAVVALVFVIACANLANLLLARAEARQREMAVRLAIGGGRGRILRQLLTESLVLAFAGGAVGLLIALWMTDALSTTMSFGPTQLDPRAPSAWMSFDVHLQATAFVFTLVVCAAAGLLFGIAPAIRGSRDAVSSVLAGRGTHGRGSSRLGDALVVVQVALSLILVMGATLFTRSVWNLKAQDIGVDRGHLMLAWINPGQTTPTTGMTAAARTMRERLARIPGVESASMSNHGLLEGNEGGAPSEMLMVNGRTAPPGLQVFRDAVAPGFFATTGTPLVSGREFDDRDGAAAPRRVVLSRTLARFLFGDDDPAGRLVKVPTDPAPLEIIGVVNDVRHGTPRDARGVWYVSADQYPALMRTMCIVVRTAGEPAPLAPAIRRELAAIDPRLPILRVDTLSEQLDEVLVHERIVAALTTIFGSIAVVVAAIGLYGIVWYALARRTSEIGVRMALGATRSAVVRMVVGGILARIAVGLLVGVPAAIACARLAKARLFGVGAADPIALIAAACGILAVSTVAALVPARRAAAVDPMEALRCD